jgi:site-specific DNA-methyltransferase (adenine-specific)
MSWPEAFGGGAIGGCPSCGRGNCLARSCISDGEMLEICDAELAAKQAAPRGRKEVIGDATLYFGDCLEVLPTLPKAAAVVITDPPYGIAYQSNAGVGSGTAPITNDGARLSLRLYRRVIPLLTPMPVLWCTRWDAWPDVYDIFGAAMKVNGLLVWDKGQPGMGDLNHWGPSYELIASCGPVRTIGSRDCSVLRFNTVPSANRNHPTEKPSALFDYLIQKVTHPGATVIDPFMGSGTTGVAAIAAGRSFVGCEIDQAYFSTACRRIEQAYRQRPLFEIAPAPKSEQLGLESV